MKERFKTLDFVMDVFIEKAIENWAKAGLILMLKCIGWIQTTEYRITIYTKTNFQDIYILKHIDIIRKTILDLWQKYWYLFLNDTPLFYLWLKYDIKWYTPLWFDMETELNYETWKKYDFRWFEYHWINKKTKTYYDINGFNMLWFNEKWIYEYTWTKYDFYWFDRYCFNKKWIYKYTWTKYSFSWYDKKWKDKNWIFNSDYLFY